MSRIVQVYVGLLDEGIDVWRPVQAEHVEGNTYRILDQPYDRAVESWQFEPGDEVVCEPKGFAEGRHLAAIRKA